jgi:hypothetical protein
MDVGAVMNLAKNEANEIGADMNEYAEQRQDNLIELEMEK